ncbi:MAG: DUF5018 domain-containing protein [Tannerellaceae bacterium]|jgi:hypothetical protein|nr:DUF5018 domain-containing protein [Tannerellaceae bacterium]
MKKGIVPFITGFIMMLMASCLGSGDIDTTTEIKDAQISSFVLSHDSITGLSSAKFTIDQVNGFIFNNDSLPYGTQVNKVICTLSYTTGVSAIKVVQEAVGDTVIWWNGTDSLDFSKPVQFTTVAYDGVTTKNYTAWVNIHQIIPDLMVWERYAGQMTGAEADEQKVIPYTREGEDAYLMYVKTFGVYPSNLYISETSANRLYYSLATDARNWQELPLNGLPDDADIFQITLFENILYVPVAGKLYSSINGQEWTKVDDTPEIKALLGVIREKRLPATLATIVKSGDAYFFAGMNKDKQWTLGETLPDHFPVSGFSSLSYDRMSNEYLTVVAGEDKNGRLLNTTWATADALSWAFLSGEQENFFEKKTGVMLTSYDDKFYLTGGINDEDKALKDIHVSIDNGITWAPADSLKLFPEDYTARGYASLHVDAGKYMLVFGGKTSRGAKTLDEIWRGRINRLK